MESLSEELDYEFEEENHDVRETPPISANTSEGPTTTSITVDEEEARKQRISTTLQKAKVVQRQVGLLVLELEELQVDASRPRTVIAVCPTLAEVPASAPEHHHAQETGATVPVENTEDLGDGTQVTRSGSQKRRGSDASDESAGSKRSKRWDDDHSSYNSEFEQEYQKMLLEDAVGSTRTDDAHLFGATVPYTWDFNDGRDSLKVIPSGYFAQTVPRPGVRCGFCDSPSHYSNDCHVFPTLGARRKRVVELRKCPACLGNHGGYCLKQLHCKICNSTRHHQSLCPHYGTRPFLG